jgi:hypothetical protein
MAETKTYWRYEARGGYGYVQFVPCRVLERKSKRVKIAALLLDGTSAIRWIHAENLIEKS